MNMVAFALILSIVGLVSSFFFIGIIISIAAFVLNVLNYKDEKSISTVRSLAISFVGILIPIIMYLNTYGFSLPFQKNEKLGIVAQILYDNYSSFGVDLSKAVASDLPKKDVAKAEDDAADEQESADVGEEEMPESKEDMSSENSEEENSPEENTEETDSEASEDGDTYKKNSIDYPEGKDLVKVDADSIFESIDSLDTAENNGYGSSRQGPSDDDMPSYGGVPVGVIIVGQYFREDDHNCNPVIVLRNETGNNCRFECVFTARDENGDEMAVSNKTVESVKNGALFVFEGRFDKNELGGKLPSMYEFLLSKRNPYENDLYDEVIVTGEIEDTSVILTAQNTSDKNAKVDAYVLFFDGEELVDCIWMIPRNAGEVCIDPGSAAAIKGDAYYKFTRIETYYTAYEAVSE
ncbi:hypothetical protein [Butyrivibrio sp. YAB3001]|uniref:hypothetical protein n=1 Tax=Butyrivibrio sp. YAB3001 TaxID=1520812 RepID=UPI0008F67FE0|nr:hypothetical protein [Butyrivibrio sp. YAB3001]SFB71312.1 hypothetical protein SAMN02910398_00386 [Butyrivibrio sp. YAB3001]